MARPMPREPPVTSATLSLSLMLIVLRLSVRRHVTRTRPGPSRRPSRKKRRNFARALVPRFPIRSRRLCLEPPRQIIGERRANALRPEFRQTFGKGGDIGRIFRRLAKNVLHGEEGGRIVAR